MKSLFLVIISMMVGSVASANAKAKVVQKILNTTARVEKVAFVESSAYRFQLRESLKEAIAESRLVGRKVTSLAIKDDTNGIRIAVKSYVKNGIVFNIEAMNLSKTQIDSLVQALERQGISHGKKTSDNHIFIDDGSFGKNENHINILISTDVTRSITASTEYRLDAVIKEVADFYSALVKERAAVNAVILTRKNVSQGSK